MAAERKCDCVQQWIAEYVGSRHENGMLIGSVASIPHSQNREFDVDKWAENDNENAGNADPKRVKTGK